MNDTIAAISTALAKGAISIIRVSGNEAITIVNKIFNGKDLKKVNDHTINYGHIYDGDILIDEVMVSIMKSPHTYTKEDVVEINAHGSIASANKILSLLLKNGCRLANPGEFTERAFLNGRIDLVEAESIMDIINSKSEKALSLAVNQLNGNTSQSIKKIRAKLSEIETNIEVNIDYPEYDDVKVLSNELIKPVITEVLEELKLLLNNSRDSKIIKEGIDTVIIGKPNVGKSSLLNKLLNEEKAIVTDIPGTTRDIVEGIIDINGIRLNLIDTAGIRDTNDVVESIGVKKSLELIDKASLILFILNNNSCISQQELSILDKIKTKNYIIIVNKIDLEKKLEINEDNIIYMSTLENIGIEELKTKIVELYKLDKINIKDFNYVSSARGISLIEKAIKSLEKSLDCIFNDMPIDIVELEINAASKHLGDILGINYKEDLLDQLFSNFCLGK